ncbi:MAG: hypothetical protein LBQ54_00980 [Planctomycetaceae bacterium]|jgi:hypothetical protein|nr:hypothetical protein [Planctomycetaceae bacterium]
MYYCEFDSEFNNGWLGEFENLRALFETPAGSGIETVSEPELDERVAEGLATPVETHPWDMAERLHREGVCPYERLTVWRQDANNCAGHGTNRAVEAFQLISAWKKTRRELTPFESFVPWVWSVGKNESGNTGSGGATMGEMLGMIVRNGVLPADTPGLPDYRGTSNVWAKRYGKQSATAPYAKFWPEAKKYLVTAVQIPKDGGMFFDICKAGFSIAFGTSTQITRYGEDGKNQAWRVFGRWMHAMAAYGYDPVHDRIGIDNSHGDGFAWANRDVVRKVVDSAAYFDGFAILDMIPRAGRADWAPIGRL